MVKKKSTFFADFKKFVSRGNVIDMATGVVIGASFNKIVTGLVNYVINPFVGIFIKDGDLDSIKTIITPAVVDAEGKVTTPEVAILWGTWLQTILDFLIVAFCLFLILRVVMRTKNMLEADQIAAKAIADKEAADKAVADAAAAKEAAEKAAAEAAAHQAKLEESIMMQEKLLAEIRDLMKNK